MSKKFQFGCSELCLNGRFEDKLELFERLDIWLEIANTGERDLSILDSSEIEVKTVQAYGLHNLHWLSPGKQMRDAAQSHVIESSRMAEEVGAQYVLVVPTYGFSITEHARKTLIENIRSAADQTSTTILVEALSPRRTSFLPSPYEVASLVEDIARENVKLALDSLHIKDSGYDPSKVIREMAEKAVEIHLKDDGSKPPGKGEIDFEGILKNCSNQLLCLEFEGEGEKEFLKSYEYILGISRNIF